MKYLLDTNICIYIIKHKPPEVRDRFNTHRPLDIGVSAITVAELEYGAYRSQHVEANRAALQQFLLPLEILAFDPAATQA
ncbi:VapC toxin family PIN domain ribonuclease [Leptolyngbya sp. BL0902]|nr:type II toxin-antitoxin system VapC family toxin [Leptolyngbya sp. BL0902]QQE63617.1 VapC toxin family PIN domain ribonuclease [Leptolyngbya sp. BL0902]